MNVSKHEAKVLLMIRELIMESLLPIALRRDLGRRIVEDLTKTIVKAAEGKQPFDQKYLADLTAISLVPIMEEMIDIIENRIDI